MSKEQSERPAFAAPLWAAARQGDKEFAQILKAFPDSIAIIEEPGTLGNPTPQMVTQEIGTVHRNDFDSVLNGYARQGHGQDDRGVEREM